MNTTLQFRRCVAVLSCIGASAALALIPSTAAQAKVKAEFFAAGNADAQYVGPTSGGTCTLTSGNDAPGSAGVTFSHGTRKQAVNLGATFTSSDNSADQVKVKGHVKSSLTLKRKHGGLKSLHLTADAAVTVSHTVSGSACRGTGSVFSEIPLLTFTEKKRGRLDLAYKTAKPNAVIQFVVFSFKTEQPVLETVNLGNHTHGTAHVKLKPGKYAIGETEVGVVNGAIFLKSASLKQKTSNAVEVTGTFTPKRH